MKTRIYAAPAVKGLKADIKFASHTKLYNFMNIWQALSIDNMYQLLWAISL